MKEIFWINGQLMPPLAIVLRPRGENRLEGELRRLKQNGIDTIVSLLEPLEAEILGLAREESAAQNAGLNFLSYPIPDGQVPRQLAGFREFIAGLVARLGQGERIGVHCQGCIGRSTVVTACALMHLGWGAHEALTAITRARGIAVPDTPEQAAWINQYKASA